MREAKIYEIRLCTWSTLEMLLELYSLATNPYMLILEDSDY